jgi:LAO/AO transport system kinase
MAAADYVEGVRAGDRSVLARTITLLESTHRDHRRLAEQVLHELLPFSGGSHRVGITGVPGVGKSTFIDQLGVNLTATGHRVAVLAVDPTSSRTGGSILGDKTRMERLATDPNAFIRPSPAGRTLGGVARATREAILVCEAAGFDVVLVETVGVGQSETVVADMVDFFLVLMLAGAGDDLQGIKKGVLELADLVAVNKADGDNVRRAELAAAEYRRALTETGELQARRQEQQVRWMWSLLDERLRDDLRSDPAVAARLRRLEAEVRNGAVTATAAVDELWSLYRGGR